MPAPVKFHWPPPRAHVLNDTLKCATLAPSPIWWSPRTTVRSSLNWNELLSAMPRVAVAAAIWNPPVTTTIIEPGT